MFAVLPFSAEPREGGTKRQMRERAAIVFNCLTLSILFLFRPI